MTLQAFDHLPMHLFVDNCILYRIIETAEDYQHLQSDLNSLIKWIMHAMANTTKPRKMCDTMVYQIPRNISAHSYIPN